MSNWAFLNKHRIHPPHYPMMTASDGFCGAFAFAFAGEARKVCCVASDGGGWQHVSVSFGADSRKTPSWEIMCAVKDLFWEPEDYVVQFHPPKSRYISNHAGCLHLWRCTDGRQTPTPPDILVGIKELGNVQSR